MTVNPYDREDTCQCSAWSEGECACGGYVDPAWKRIWQKGYDAATARAEKAEQECRDRECTEQDVRARLADAENALARVAALRDGLCDCDTYGCTGTAWVLAINAALDGTS